MGHEKKKKFNDPKVSRIPGWLQLIIVVSPCTSSGFPALESRMLKYAFSCMLLEGRKEGLTLCSLPNWSKSRIIEYNEREGEEDSQRGPAYSRALNSHHKASEWVYSIDYQTNTDRKGNKSWVFKPSAAERDTEREREVVGIVRARYVELGKKAAGWGCGQTRKATFFRSPWAQTVMSIKDA